MIEKENLVSKNPNFITNKLTENEVVLERTLRPNKLNDYIGQNNIREQINIFIQATLLRNEALDHVLLFGQPGLGKTTLARIIAHELNVNFRQTSGPVLERPGDLAAILTNLEAKDILFVDEIHRLSPIIEELLYPALEEYQIDIIIGEGPSAKNIKLDLQPFTLIGATTKANKITNPLRDRFGIIARLEFYSIKELANIIERSSNLLGLSISKDAALEIAQRSRGTPRIANRLLRRIRDYTEVKSSKQITLKLTNMALSLFKIDSAGFDVIDCKLLKIIIERFNGGPVGLDSLAATIGEKSETIEDMIEPFLIQQGFLQRTPRGRIATLQTYQHFGITYPFSI